MREFKNFLPSSLANELHDKMTSNEFPWFWLDDVTVSPKDRSEVPEFYRVNLVYITHHIVMVI